MRTKYTKKKTANTVKYDKDQKAKNNFVFNH